MLYIFSHSMANTRPSAVGPGDIRRSALAATGLTLAGISTGAALLAAGTVLVNDDGGSDHCVQVSSLGCGCEFRGRNYPGALLAQEPGIYRLRDVFTGIWRQEELGGLSVQISDATAPGIAHL